MRRGILVVAVAVLGLTLSGCACCGPCWVVAETGKDAVRTTGRVAQGGLRLTGKAAQGSLQLAGKATGGLLAETDGLVHRTSDRLLDQPSSEK